MIARFQRDLDNVWPGGKTGRLALAISGGPDSAGLLLLAHAAWPGRIEAATVDHGLRPEAAAEAELAASVCAALDVPHRTLRVTVPAGNLQDAARRARYHALAEWAQERGLAALATAHHADDQAETLLMRLNRGSGVAGLAGVRGRSTVPDGELPLLRPLLGWRRAELAEVVAQAGVNIAQDPSNTDQRFDRVRVRQALADADWIDPLALSVSAGNLADADAALDWAAEREWQENVSAQGNALCYDPAAPRAIRIRIIARIIAQIGTGARGSGAARLVDDLTAGQAGSLGGVLAKPKGGRWIFEPEPKIRKN